MKERKITDPKWMPGNGEFVRTHGYPFQAFCEHGQWQIQVWQEMLEYFRNVPLVYHVQQPYEEWVENNRWFKEDINTMLKCLEVMKGYYEVSDDTDIDREFADIEEAKERFFDLYRRWFFMFWC